jgi:hypothetical protein
MSQFTSLTEFRLNFSLKGEEELELSVSVIKNKSLKYVLELKV